MRSLRVSHAFHSPLMEPMLDSLSEAAQQVQGLLPHIPMVSNVNGKLVNTVLDTNYWCRHARQAVRFSDGIETMVDSEGIARIERGTYQLRLEIERYLPHEQLIENLMRHELCLFETDTILKSSGFANPASYGAFPRILGRFARDKKILGLSEAAWGVAANVAGAEDTPPIDRLVVAGAEPAGRGDPRVILEQHANVSNETLAQVIRDLDVVAEHHIAARFQETHVARGGADPSRPRRRTLVLAWPGSGASRPQTGECDHR